MLQMERGRSMDVQYGGRVERGRSREEGQWMYSMEEGSSAADGRSPLGEGWALVARRPFKRVPRNASD